MERLAQQIEKAIIRIPDTEVFGRVTKVLGLLVEITGFSEGLSIGSLVYLMPKSGREIPCVLRLL